MDQCPHIIGGNAATLLVILVDPLDKVNLPRKNPATTREPPCVRVHLERVMAG